MHGRDMLVWVSVDSKGMGKYLENLLLVLLHPSLLSEPGDGVTASESPNPSSATACFVGLGKPSNQSMLAFLHL